VKFIDANYLTSPAVIEADLCIVGAGVAGLTVATELDGLKQAVCLVESGSYGPDEMTQALYDLEVVGYAVRENFMSRARYFGGTSNLWAGRSMSLSPLDLRRREWIPHSGWPISYEELNRYYPAAARILRLPSLDRLERVVSRSRVHPIERCLVNDGDLQPNVAVWGRKPLRFGRALRRKLHASRNISVYLNANVTEIELNGAGNHVEACAGVTLAGKMIRFRARRFVLACGGLETARLLLASRAVLSRGVGNQHDVVGRFYMDHPRAVFGRVRFSPPQKLPTLLGAALPDGMAQVGIHLSDEIQEREQRLNNYLTLERHWSDQAAKAYQSFVYSAKILLRKGYSGSRLRFSRPNLAKVPELIYLFAPRELIPHSMYRAARELKQWFSKGATDLVVVNYCEQAPNPNSRVYLGRDRDRLGVPRLVLDWVVGQEETASLMRLQDLVDARLRRHRLGYLDRDAAGFSDLRYTDASHHLGTTRMSADPREGVVDEHCQVHGVANLFIGGSGVFPTAGHANPTLTIVALAIRLAAHLKRAPA
jgi:choline dehydrogenase-like flavoprotein